MGTLVMRYRPGEDNSIWIDGVKAAEVPVSSGEACLDDEPLTIGNAGYHTGFKGEIKDVAAWTRALSDAEIQEGLLPFSSATRRFAGAGVVATVLALMVQF